MQKLIRERKDKKIYRDGDKLIKLFDENYSKSNILNEALNQARVAETGLNIPKIHEVTVIGGKSAIVMDFIEGRALDECFRDEPERTDEWLDLFVRVQQDIHSRKHLLLTKYIDKLRMKILQSDLAASTRYDLSLRLDAMPRHTHVLHGDFLPSNVILRDDGVPFIADWSHASQGNAAADAAKTFLMLRTYGVEELAWRYRAEYIKRACIEERYFTEWIPLIAAAQLIRAPERRQQLIGWMQEAGD